MLVELGSTVPNVPLLGVALQQEAENFRFRKKRNCTVRVAKIKALISFANREADLRLCFRICKMLFFYYLFVCVAIHV